MTHNWQLPPEFIKDYLAACKKAATDDKAFATFRQDPHIACVIENNTPEHAQKMLDKMSPRYRKMVCYNYGPTMIRYVYTLMLIEQLIGVTSSIIEIGGGYGGMCEVISCEAGLDDCAEDETNDQYTIYDLPEVIGLQKRYLADREIAMPNFMTSLKDPAPPADLCLSWCAWSELDKPLRVEYAFKVISQCKHFFICSNYNKAEDMEILQKYWPIKIKEYDDELVTNVIYI